VSTAVASCNVEEGQITLYNINNTDVTTNTGGVPWLQTVSQDN